MLNFNIVEEKKINLDFYTKKRRNFILKMSGSKFIIQLRNFEIKLIEWTKTIFYNEKAD